MSQACFKQIFKIVFYPYRYISSQKLIIHTCNDFIMYQIHVSPLAQICRHDPLERTLRARYFSICFRAPGSRLEWPSWSRQKSFDSLTAFESMSCWRPPRVVSPEMSLGLQSLIPGPLPQHWHFRDSGDLQDFLSLRDLLDCRTVPNKLPHVKYVYIRIFSEAFTIGYAINKYWQWIASMFFGLPKRSFRQ